jgi:hypothetical protein
MGLESKQSWGVGKHWSWIGSSEAFSSQKVEKDVGILPAEVGIGTPFGRRVAKVAPTLDHLLWGTAADPELQAAVADQVSRSRILDHVERIFVSHVDHGCSDFDPARSASDRREQREGGGELPRKVMHAKVCAVSAQLLRGDREVDRLLQNIAR